MISQVNEYKSRIESILNINNDLIKLKSKSPDNKSEIKNVKERMLETVKGILNLKKKD